MSTSEIVRKQMHRIFGSCQADNVIAALDAADLSLGMMGADRVHLAILFLSGGDTRQFHEALSQAQPDIAADRAGVHGPRDPKGGRRPPGR